MPPRRKVRSADSFNVLASWLQQPSHLVGESQLTENSPGSASLEYLSTAEDLLNADQKSEPDTHLRHSSGTSPYSGQTRKDGRRTHRQAHSLSEGASSVVDSQLMHRTVSSRVWHPGVETLLTEYYKLLDTTAPRDSSFVAERYRKSLMERLFGALTTKLPTFLQLRTISQKIGAWMDRCTTESPIILLIALVIGLQLLRFLYMSVGLPSIVCFVLGSLGFRILQKSEKRYKASMRQETENIATLGVFEGGRQTNTLSNGARSYRTANSADSSRPPFASIEWSAELKRVAVPKSDGSDAFQDTSPLQNPPNTIHTLTDSEMLEHDIRQIRVALLGARGGDLVPPSGSNNATWIVEAVQELCNLVGVECLQEERTDIHSIRIKIGELREAVGV